MKKILFLLSFVAVMFTAKSQSVITQPLLSQYSLLTDTVTNTGTNYLTPVSTAPIKGYFKTVLIVFKSDKISGTLAGTATPQFSANGTDYADIPGATAYTLTDVATQTASWKITDWAGVKLRVKVVGTGTMSGKIYASSVFKN